MNKRLPLPLLILMALCSAQRSNGEWETVRHEGHDYVTARSVQMFYAFDALEERDGQLVFRTGNINCALPLIGREAFLNGVRLVLERPVVEDGERYLVPQILLTKTLDPILRPGSGKDLATMERILIHADPDGPDGATDRSLALASALREELQERKGIAELTPDALRAAPSAELLATTNGGPDALLVILRFVRTGDEAPGLLTRVLAPAGEAGSGNKPGPEYERAVPGNENDWLNIATAVAVHSRLCRHAELADLGLVRSREALLEGSTHPAVLLEFRIPAAGEKGISAEEIAAVIADGIQQARRATQPRESGILPGR